MSMELLMEIIVPMSREATLIGNGYSQVKNYTLRYII